jgi:DNA polymerase-3 subunit beta
MTRSLSAGQVSVAATDSEVEIGSGRGQFRVKALTPDDYPALPIEDRAETGNEVRIDLEPGALAVALSQVVRAASTDESRQILTGVLWELDSSSVTLAATDSYRLGVRTLPIEGSALAEPRKVVLPARALAELVRALQGGARAVSATVKDNLVAFTVAVGEAASSEWVIGSRFIEGEFPKYQQLIPAGYPNKLLVDREQLLEVTKRVGLLAQNNLPVKLQLGAELEVSAHTPDVGEGQEVIDAEYNGESFVIAFNPQFLHDGASAISTDRLVMEVGDGLKPALLRGENDDSFTYLLMPVRLS